MRRLVGQELFQHCYPCRISTWPPRYLFWPGQTPAHLIIRQCVTKTRVWLVNITNTWRCLYFTHSQDVKIWDYWTVLSGRVKESTLFEWCYSAALLLCGEGSLHERRRGLSCFVKRLGRRGAQAAPVWDAARLVVVVSGHRPAAQDVLQRPEDGACGAEDGITERAFKFIGEYSFKTLFLQFSR